MYKKWDTPKKLIFNNSDFSGITPANMLVTYVNTDENYGDKDLLNAFILSKKVNDYPNMVDFLQLVPRKFDNSVVVENLNNYFKDSIVNELYDNQALSDYQGFYKYNLNKKLENFKDAPLLLIKDSKTANDGAQYTLENSEFIAEKNQRTFWQRLTIINPTNTGSREMRVFERIIKQRIMIGGFVLSDFSRWYDSSRPVIKDVLPKEQHPTGKLDYLSLAGSNRIFNAADYENTFTDTPIKQYKYYKLPLKKDHPLLQNLDKKNVIVEVTKGTNYEGDPNKYEVVFKMTYQDDYAELQFRRLMRFDRNDQEAKVGGRNRASYVSPWAYVYYTTPDDSAPDGYVDNPNQGIDQKFWDIINNLQNQINNLDNRVTNLEKIVDELVNQIGGNNDALKKILEKLQEIGVWNQTGDTIINGEFKPGKGIAGGSINLFGGSADSEYYIRTNAGKTENDLVGGV